MKFTEFISSLSQKRVKIVAEDVPFSSYFLIDLSANNPELIDTDVSNLDILNTYIENTLKLNDAKIAYGGYNEVRNIYKRSLHFNNDKMDRDHHIGFDLWYTSFTKVFTPLDGEVHSYNNNLGLGNYGPTLILKHDINNTVFYTLYAHLSLDSLDEFFVGKPYKKGDWIANIGESFVNGDYPPHLHFQIIKDLQGFEGDYPGVCTKEDLAFYLENCPDPNLLLKYTQ